jgi:TrmH family RNA methyltransferase
VLEAMSPARTPGGVVALAARPHHSLATVIAGTMPLVIVAVEIQDPGNLGAMARAVEAGGATGMLTTPGTADPFGWKALRGAMGSSFRLPIAAVDSVEEAVIEARAAGLQVVATVGHGGTPMADAPLEGPTLLMLGSEGQGLPSSVLAAADHRVSIPMTPPVESLNVAVAAALLVYEARRQRFDDNREGAKARGGEGLK